MQNSDIKDAMLNLQSTPYIFTSLASNGECLPVVSRQVTVMLGLNCAFYYPTMWDRKVPVALNGPFQQPMLYPYQYMIEEYTAILSRIFDIQERWS